MYLKKIMFGMSLCAIAGMLLVGCSGAKEAAKREKVAGLDELGAITALSREDGSGTRSTFAELLGFSGSDNAEVSDQTREDAVIVENTESILAAIRSDKSAIGYVSGGAVTKDDEVKELQMEGITLSRTFYLAYSGKLSDLELDFLTYVRGAGQEIVGENYQTVAKSTSFLSNKETGSINIGGSSSVAPLLEELAKEYMTINPMQKLKSRQRIPETD